jgi:hypothetical protein
MTVSFALKAKHSAILHVVLVIHSQDLIQFLLCNLFFLAISTFVAYIATSVTAYFDHLLWIENWSL